MKKLFIFILFFSLFAPEFLFAEVENTYSYSFEVYDGSSSYPVISDTKAVYDKTDNTITAYATIKDISGISVANAVFESSGEEMFIADATHDKWYAVLKLDPAPKLLPGIYTVYFSAMDNLGNQTPENSAFANFSVQASPTNIDLSITPNPVEYGVPFSVSAVLKDLDTGEPLAKKTIDFYFDSEYDKIGSKKTGSSGEPATLNITDAYLPRSYTIIAKYAGDSEYLSATEQKLFDVAAHSGVSLSVSPSSAKPNDTITLTANLYCTDTDKESMRVSDNSVKFYFDDNLISTTSAPSGQAKINYTLPNNTSLTTHTLYAKYEGGPAYVGSFGDVMALSSESNKVTLTVSNPLTVSASAVASPVYLNPTSTVTFSSTVSGGTGSYTYTWSGDCSGKNPTCMVTASTAKTYTATLKVVSGETKTASASVTVYPKLIVSAVASPSQASLNQTVTFSAVVPPEIAGSCSYSWSGFCSGTGQVCQTSFSSIGNYQAFVNVTYGVQEAASSASVAVVQSCGNNLVDSRDGKVYGTVLIGSQCWMAENLNVGNMMNASSSQGTSCSLIRKYCYSNSASSCTSYGGLYQWNQAMCGSTTEGAQGICPDGWHIPTHSELTTMERTICYQSDTVSNCNLAFPDNTTTYNQWLGTVQAVGTKLKTGGSSGFNALLSGYVYPPAFNYLNSQGFIWTSTPYSASAWYRKFMSNQSGVYRNRIERAYGMSVRCVKN